MTKGATDHSGPNNGEECFKSAQVGLQVFLFGPVFIHKHFRFSMAHFLWILQSSHLVHILSVIIWEGQVTIQV